MIRHSGWYPWELTYSGNVHPGETPEALAAVITGGVAGVRRRRQLEWMGTGLWLNAALARMLAQDAAARARFKAGLAQNRLILFTLNGFPFGGFHDAAVKAAVYTPDWADPRRLAYTRDLAGLLADCLPAGAGEGTLSTLPLGYSDWTSNRQQAATAALAELAGWLAELRERCGRCIRVCLEMEPGCVLDRTPALIRWFSDELPAAGRRLGISGEILRQHLGVCFDICHQAVMFEDIGAALESLRAAGIGIGKIQISSALAAAQPADPATRAALAAFAEPRYLHQVRTRGGAGVLGVMDLPEAFGALPTQHPWRVHFHVPIQATELADGTLTTTQSAILDALDFLVAHSDLHPHLEVETYTWQVLPDELRPRTEADLGNGLAAELAWLETQMARRGLRRA